MTGKKKCSSIKWKIIDEWWPDSLKRIKKFYDLTKHKNIQIKIREATKPIDKIIMINNKKRIVIECDVIEIFRFIPKEKTIFFAWAHNDMIKLYGKYYKKIIDLAKKVNLPTDTSKITFKTEKALINELFNPLTNIPLKALNGKGCVDIPYKQGKHMVYDRFIIIDYRIVNKPLSLKQKKLLKNK